MPMGGRPLGRGLRLMAHYFRFNLSAGMEYRASFLVQVLGMALNNSAFIIFWLMLFERLGTDIKGYSFTDVMFLWALAAAGYGLAGLLWGNAQSISRTIYSGDLDVYLLQPKPVLFNLLSSRMIIACWGDLLYGVVLFILTQPLSFHTVGLFVFFSFLMAGGITCLRVAYHSLTFLLGNAEDLASTASELVLSFTLYPGSIFDGPARWLLHSLIPAALLAYIPARLFAAFDLELFATLLAADLGLLGVALLAFHAGLRRYESGNRIGTRV